jgi:DNA-binding beta-propeller fold protein YncE
VPQIAAPIPNFQGGSLINVAPDGTRTTVNVDLFAPGGVAVAKDGTIYVTNFSILPGGGQVIAIRPQAPRGGFVGFRQVSSGFVRFRRVWSGFVRLVEVRRAGQVRLPPCPGLRG